MDEEEKTEKPKKQFNVDDLAEFVVKVADVAHNEEAEVPEGEREAVARPNAQCPQCGSGDVDIWNSDDSTWKCSQCGNVFEFNY